ncbi:MAG TPA: AraC family transcriptional regulator [Chitinophagaceae bacterium]
MAIELTLAQHGLLEFLPGLPPDYARPVLRGSVAITAKSNFTNIVVQELTGDEYSIRFIIGKFLKRVTANGHIQNRGLYSYFMLKNGLRKEIDSIGKIHLRQDHYVCFFTEPTECKIKFEKNIEYSAIDIFYSPKLLQELLPFFPELKTVLDATSGIVIRDKTCWSLPAMKEITNQLLNCPYDESTIQFYFDLKVRELLFQILENAYKRTATEQFFTPWEIGKIHQARTILEDHISKKPPSIKSLSKQVALNVYKLKTGFRQYFSTGIFEWLLEKKMQYAKDLIFTTNRPIKEICKMVGYPLSTNFITAFRRQFGVTPGSLRRK